VDSAASRATHDARSIHSAASMRSLVARFPIHARPQPKPESKPNRLTAPQIEKADCQSSP
jgi:hypothetical protein